MDNCSPRILPRIVATFLLVLALPATFQGEETDKPAAAPRYEFREDHDPNGTGKFYFDREIAQVMGHLGAGWLERPEREREEQPRLLMDALRLRPGMTVADIGAGTGYFTFRMAEKVGISGKVYAVDIQPEMLSLLHRTMEERKITNVVPVQGTPVDPKLPPASVDLILMVDVYHEFSHPYEMTVAMLKALKPNGRIVFVEYRLEDPKVPIKKVHRMAEAQVRKEMEIHPLRWVETVGTLPRQHVIVFEKKP